MPPPLPFANWPDNLRTRVFKAAEVADLTGVGQDLQRKWTERHFDFRAPSFMGQRAPGSRGFSWIGVQMLAVFADVFSDLNDTELATAALMLKPPPGWLRGGRYFPFAVDHRARPTGDFYACLSEWRKPAYFVTAGEGGQNVQLGDRTYAYNISAMQRRLCEKLG